MAETHVLSALIEKRARLAGELRAAQFKVMALKVDLGCVDQCLSIFRSEIDPASIPAKVTFGKSPAGLPKGAGTRTALEILRETGGSFTSQELAAAILHRYGRPLEPRPLGMLAKAIQSNFSRRSDGIVIFCRDSYPGKWRLNLG